MEFLSLKGGCRGSPEPTLVKIPHCWKSHVTAQLLISGVWFILFDISKSVALPAADLGDQTVSYYGGKDCLSFGNLDVSVDLNLTEGELDKVRK